MACKQGIRQNIEKSKEQYKKQKEHDPIRELWLSLVERVDKGPDGFAGLSVDEKLYFAVRLLDGEVYNGGFEQFFHNSSGEYFDEAARGLKLLEAESTLSVFLQATKILFGDSTPSKDRGARWEQMKSLPDSPVDQVPDWYVELESLDQQYCKDPDNLDEKLDEFARSSLLPRDV